MAINYPGPYEVDMTLLVPVSGLTLTHHLRFNCIALGDPVPGTAFSAIDLQTRGGGTVKADIAVGNLWAFLRLHFNTSVTVSDVKLWKYFPSSLAKTFISANTASLPAGANAAPTVAAHQATFSFRSGAGGSMKITLLEDVNSFNNQQTLIANAAGTDSQKVAAYVISSAGWMIARDDGFPIAPTYFTGGQNEATFKRRFRA